MEVTCLDDENTLPRVRFSSKITSNLGPRESGSQTAACHTEEFHQATSIDENRSPVLGPLVEDLAGLGSSSHHRKARDRYQLAPEGLQALLEVEEPAEKQGPSSNHPRDP